VIRPAKEVRDGLSVLIFLPVIPGFETKRQEVIIRRRNGEQFSVALRPQGTSPFDVAPVSTKATTQDILEAIRESRERE
jgi:hypothetical protein